MVKKTLNTTILLAAMLLSTMVMAEDLMQVYDMALGSDPQLLAGSSARQATDELAVQAKARFLPQVNLIANNSRILQDTNIKTRDGSYNNHGYTLKLIQPVYLRENFVRRKQADIAIEGAKAIYLAVQQDLIVRVAESYFDLLTKQNDLTFATAEKEAIYQQLTQAKQRFDVGLATVTDVSEARAAYDLALASVISAENELVNSRERLREIAGRYPDTISELQDDTPLVRPQPEDIDKWSEASFRQNPALRVATMAVYNAQQGIELQKTGHYPTLNVSAQRRYKSDSLNGGGEQSHQDTFAVEFSLPIYSGGSVLSKTREAENRLNEAVQNEEKKRREVQRQSREYYNSVILGISRVEAFKQAVISNEKALESTEAGYEVGTRTTVDVLNVRRDLFKAKRNHAQSRYDYILDSLRLKATAGSVTVDDLKQINQWLER